MRLVICDDDYLIVEKIEKYLKAFFSQINQKVPEISCFHDGESLLADPGDKDILFLDIEMPGIDGISVGQELKKANKDIIIFIITSFSEYLDEAMRFQVFRYLSKPIDRQRFFRNMKDALNLYHTTSIKIPIETKQGLFTLPATAIISIETKGRVCLIHTTQADYESIHNIQYWSEALPDNIFFQTHRSYIVNFEHISNFNHNTIYLSDSQLQVYLAKRKYSPFKKAYLLFLESMR